MTSVPTHRPFDGVRPVLVPVCSAVCVETVVGAAAEMCAGLGVTAILLDVVQSPDGLERGVQVRGKTVEAVLRDDSCAHLRVLADILAGSGVEVQLSIREGELVKNILEEARGTDAQMIVMGAEAERANGCTVPTDAAETVSRSSDVPVMVVRVGVDDWRRLDVPPSSGLDPIAAS